MYIQVEGQRFLGEFLFLAKVADSLAQSHQDFLMLHYASVGTIAFKGLQTHRSPTVCRSCVIIRFESSSVRVQKPQGSRLRRTMVKISRGDAGGSDPASKRFSRLKTPSLAEAKIRERHDLQELIWNSSEEFCLELGEDLLIIGKEVQPSTVVADRIDLLALDGDGATVILELKRGNDKLQLFQAISYAGMVAGLALKELLRFPGIDLSRVTNLGAFLGADAEPDEAVNQVQRIILIAEAFDFEVLVGAKWLYETYEVNVACVRVLMAVDETSGAEYLAFTQIFPTPEIEEVAKLRGRRRSTAPGAAGRSSPDRKYTVDELLKLAADQQILPIITACRRLGEIWDEGPSGGSFMYSIMTDSGWRSLCRVYVSSEKLRTQPDQVDVSVVTRNLAEVTGQDEAVIRDTLAHGYSQQASYVKYCIIRLSTPAQAEALVAQLKEWWNLRPKPSVGEPTEKLSENAAAS